MTCPPTESPLGDPATLAAACRRLRDGGVVVVPTDTSYGLAADPTSADAVRVIFEIKGRPAEAALPLIAASLAQVEAWAGPLDPRTRRVAEACWPGPLSVIVDAPSSVVATVHGGRGTVAIRVPANAVAQALCAAWGAPLTATSANVSGEPPAIDVKDLGALAADRRVFVLDGGRLAGEPSSTIVDARRDPPILVRAGTIAWDRVLKLLDQ
jgi:L-threonylcarbamoyladenylate synthase